jgi:putative methionine-R-sulfoxide reductase with GAF domain
MTNALNDRYRVNLILTVCFILGVGISLYFIYSLPSDLRLASGYETPFVKVYITLALTFVLGAVALSWALRYKKEVLVFRDRIIDSKEAEREAAAQANRTTISLDAVLAGINQAKTEKEILTGALQAICKQIEAGQGALYLLQEENGKRTVQLKAGYALSKGESTVISYEIGDGLIGQAAATGTTLFVDDVPEGYINIISGLGSSSPKYLLIVALKKQQQIVGVMEIASFTKTTDDERKFVEESAQLIADKI